RVDPPALHPVQHPVVVEDLPPNPAKGVLVGIRPKRIAGQPQILRVMQQFPNGQRRCVKTPFFAEQHPVHVKQDHPIHAVPPLSKPYTLSEHFLILYQITAENPREWAARPDLPGIDPHKSEMEWVVDEIFSKVYSKYHEYNHIKTINNAIFVHSCLLEPGIPRIP